MPLESSRTGLESTQISDVAYDLGDMLRLWAMLWPLGETFMFG